MTDKQT